MTLQNDTEILRPLVDRLIELSALPEQEIKKKLWADHQALRPVPRMPVCVYYEGIPSQHWKLMLGEDHVRCEDSLARTVEQDLRKRIWMAENVPDDHIVWPSIVVSYPAKHVQGWGVDLGWHSSGAALGAKGYDPPFKDKIDLSRLTTPRVQFDDDAGADLMEKASELVEGRLTVFPRYADISFAPFDVATHMRGMQGLLLDCALAPDDVAGLVDFVAAAQEQHLERREREGRINCHHHPGTRYQQVGFRVHCADVEEGFEGRKPLLRDEWVYLSAQTSAGLGPPQYAKLVQPFTERHARYFTDQTVYYHACECLDHKMDVIAGLSNLRRYHVSPWSNLGLAVEKFQGQMVLEAHDHPGETFFCATKDEMRQRIRSLFEQSQGHPMDVNISDIHSFNDDPALLTQWAQLAREESERAAT